MICIKCGRDRDLSKFCKRGNCIDKKCRACRSRPTKTLNNSPASDLPEEIWVNIIGFEGLYQVSNYSRIKGLSRTILCSNGSERREPEKILKKILDKKSGYASVGLSGNSLYKKMLVHRIVAMAFIPNPDLKPEVNHKDGDKLNNLIENLEWVTSSENSIHCIYVLRNGVGATSGAKARNGKTLIIKATNKETGTEHECIGTYDASKLTGLHNSHIHNIIIGKIKNNKKWGFIKTGVLSDLFGSKTLKTKQQ